MISPRPVTSISSVINMKPIAAFLDDIVIRLRRKDAASRAKWEMGYIAKADQNFIEIPELINNKPQQQP
jgi:hypothetical protein